MTGLKLLLARMRGLFGKSRMERDLDAELRFHFEQEVELLVARGMRPEEARAEARKRFGGLDRAKEAYRDARGIPLLENFARDLRYGARQLLRNPGFTAVAVLSLGLGIGVNCAVFTITNAAILRDLPVKEPDRLAQITVSVRGRQGLLSYPAFREISEQQNSFSGLAASGALRLQHVVFEGVELQELGRLGGAMVSANYFQTMGVEAVLGRVFLPRDSGHPGGGEVAVLRHAFWETALGGDPDVIGKTIVVNRAPLTVIGVAPPGFSGDSVGQVRDLWVPILMQPRLEDRDLLESRTAAFFRTIGRLRPEVNEAQASAEITALYQQIVARENAAGTGSRINRVEPSEWHAAVIRGADGLNHARGRLTTPLAFAMGVVALVLLIACCNVANLLLARGAARRHEIGTRLASEQAAAAWCGSSSPKVCCFPQSPPGWDSGWPNWGRGFSAAPSRPKFCI